LVPVGLALAARRIAILVLLGVGAVFAAFQTRIIFPGHASQGLPETVVQPAPGTELVRLKTSEGDAVVGLFGPALDAVGRPLPDASTRPTLLYFYGNAMNSARPGPSSRISGGWAVNVLIPDYVGYGMSGGSPGESACYATADAAYDHLRSRPDVDPARIVAAGWSSAAPSRPTSPRAPAGRRPDPPQHLHERRRHGRRVFP
jgi:hypothetical protein